MKMKCNCEHDFQDKEHGKGVRVHNPCKEGKTFRCTVCGNEKVKANKEV